jgi:hypothetical protein
MKIRGIALLAILLIAAAALVWNRQRAVASAQQRETTALQTQVESLQSALAEAKAPPLSQPVPVETPVAVPSPTPSPALPNSAASPVSMQVSSNAAMLQDPETRALIRKQQDAVTQKRADKIVDKNFIQDWKLAPADVQRVKELFRDKIQAGQDVVNAMMFDGLDDTALAERGRAAKEKIQQADEALRAALGADGFEALKLQEQTLDHRDRLRRIREEMASAEVPLSKAQQDSLLETMGAERQAFNFRVDISDPSKVDYENLRDFFSSQNIDLFLEDMQQLNTRIAERALLFLSPEQGDQLRTMQQHQLDQARLTMKMTTELFNKRRKN